MCSSAEPAFNDSIIKTNNNINSMRSGKLALSLFETKSAI